MSEWRNNIGSASNPDYIEPPTNHHCSICKYGIFSGDDYIENENGDLAHWECIKDTRHLLGWFGYRVKIMEDTKDEEFY